MVRTPPDGEPAAFGKLRRVFYRAGLRCSEALDLRVRDVRLERSEIRVNAGKGDKDRVVWIDSTTIEILERWKLTGDQEGAGRDPRRPEEAEPKTSAAL